MQLETVREKIEIYKEELPEDWDAYVQNSPQGTWYHRSGWKRIIETAFGHESFYLAARREGRLVGILPLSFVKSHLFGKFLVSTPYGCSGGVCAEDLDSEQALVDQAKALSRELGVRYLELRSRDPLKDPEFQTKFFKHTFQLHLPENEETLWQNFSPEIRSKVRKSAMTGCVVQIGGLERVRDFYVVFCRRMKELGTPVYPECLFMELFKIFGEDVQVICVKKRGKPVGGGILIFDGKRAEVPWSAALKETFSFNPNHAMFWSAICEAIRRGCCIFDFGTSNQGSNHADFKRRWGANPIQLHWQYYGIRGKIPDLSPRNDRFQWAIWLWRHLPLSVANRLGPFITQGIP